MTREERRTKVGAGTARGRGFAMPARPRRSKPWFVALSWVLVAAMMVFVFFMSSNTSTGLNEGLGFFSGIYRQLQVIEHQLLGPGVDVLSPMAHFCEYTLLGAAFANALRASGMRLSRAWLLAIALTSAYGVTDEFHQLFVDGRMCDPADWLVDTCGGLLGASIVRLALRKRR